MTETLLYSTQVLWQT